MDLNQIRTTATIYVLMKKTHKVMAQMTRVLMRSTTCAMISKITLSAKTKASKMIQAKPKQMETAFSIASCEMILDDVATQ